MKYSKTVHQALKYYANNPNLVNSFGQPFGKGLKSLDKFPNNPNKAAYQYTFPKTQVNIQNTAHGGALATMVDVATTISILMLTPMRTISISLNTQFLSVVKLQQMVEIQTQITKIGKNIVFTECSIFTDPQKDRKLACKGSHIKAILQDEWNFIGSSS